MALLKLSSPWMLRSSLFSSRGSFTGFEKKSLAAIVVLRIQEMRKTTIVTSLGLKMWKKMAGGGVRGCILRLLTLH